MFLQRPLLRSAIALVTACLIGSACAQAGAGGMTLLNPPQAVGNDGKIEVLEFFAYGCIFCFKLEPGLSQWAAKQPADVRVKRVPAAAAIHGIDSAPIFHTLEAMGLQEKLQQKIFDAANVEHIILGHAPTLLKWLEKQGVDAKKYEETQRSFSVQNRIARSRQMNADYQVQGLPTIVINGRYVVEQLADSGRMFANIDRLLAEIRAARPTEAAAKPATAPPKGQ